MKVVFRAEIKAYGYAYLGFGSSRRVASMRAMEQYIKSENAPKNGTHEFESISFRCYREA